MHENSLEPWQHVHDFSIDCDKPVGFLEYTASHVATLRDEKNTTAVMCLTAITMAVEIIAGSFFGSMALLADGWHMATHVTAFGITVFAYQYARRHASNPKYTYGTGKVTVLGGYTSAVALAVTALTIALESVTRLFEPQSILFNEAIVVSILGLVVNLASAWLLLDRHHHDDRSHHHHHDSNLKAAYIHVLTDALTSFLATIALFAGKYLGWIWLDGVMGLVSAGVIIKWSYNLLKETSGILLDGASDENTKLEIVSAIEADADNHVTDLHIWHISQQHLAATIVLVTDDPRSPEYYKNLLQNIPNLTHIIVEVNLCQGEPYTNTLPSN